MSTRRRRIARVGFLALAGALLLFALMAAWLLRTGSGRDFTLARVVAALPTGTLTWERAEGTVAGPLVLHGVRYTNDGMVVELQHVTLDLAPGALTGRRLHVESLTLENGRVELPSGQEAPEPWPEIFKLPEAPPALTLPVSIQVDRLLAGNVRIEQAGATLIEIRRLEAIGSFEDGRLELQQFDIDSDHGTLRAKGDLDSSDRWHSVLHASVDLTGVGEAPLPMMLTLSGNLEQFTLELAARLPAPATLTLTASDGPPNPRWTAKLEAPFVDPRRFGSEGEPIALRFDATGDLRDATIVGHVQRGDMTVTLEPSTIRYRAGVLELAPLALSSAQGDVSARGSIDLEPAQPVVALDMTWADVLLRSSDGQVVVSTRGKGRIEGPLDDYAITLDGTLQRAAETAQIELQGRGSLERLQFDSLALHTPRGELQAQGSIAWAPQVAWEVRATLRDFDPGFLAPDFPGAVDAGLMSQGTLVDGAAQGTLTLEPLGGQLRGRALAGRLDAAISPDRSGRTNVDLRVGKSRIVGNGRWSDRVDANIELAPLSLGDLFPDMAGELRGALILTGSRDTPHIDAALDGTAISMAGFAADTLRLRGRVEQFADGTLSLQAQGVDLAGQRFGTLSLSGAGSRARHEVSLALGEGVAAIALEMTGGERESAWRGSLRSLRIEPRDRPAWVLRAPAALAYDFDSGALLLDEACLALADAALCVDADWQESAGSARFTLDRLALATLDPFLGDAFGTPVSAQGMLSARGEMHRNAQGIVTGSLESTSARGNLSLKADTERELLVYEDLRVEGTLDNERLHASANAKLAGGGSVSAQFASAGEAIEGRVEARIRDLTFLELFSGQLVDPKGAFDANLAIAGTRAAPLLAGDAKLVAFAAELPALGLELTAGEITLRSRGARAVDIRGQVRSGSGLLRVEGFYDAARDAEETLALTLKGETVTVVDLPELTAAASPDLTLSLMGEKLQLRGTVDVPLARIELERLQSATRPSTDVVIVDAEDETGQDVALDSEVIVELGEDVKLNGFGLAGRLTGQIAVRDRPGRATVARGSIEVTGQYKAYGQDLEITRGRLAYVSTPIDDPSLDIRAQRAIDEMTVGVQVRGTALAPQLTLWSDPALDQAEQLSYLVLGRPLRSASQAEGAQLTQAAATIGGNLLAKRLGARMGLDEMGVADNRALGGAALTVGKYLSPKLYVSYGVALFGSGQVVTFKYLLSRVWSVQIDSGTENRAALNYRLER